MRKYLPWIVTAVVVCTAGVVVLRKDRSGESVSRVAPTETHDAGAAVDPLPQGVDVDVRKSALGGLLFHDARFSKDGKISCSTCHDLTSGGDDGKRVSNGVGGVEGDMNSPTVFNSRFSFRQFWDGRAETLEEQVEGPLLHPKEMASSWDEVLAVIAADAGYAPEFRGVYSDGITRTNVKNAIAEFERSLVTPNSRFDRFLRGEASALTAEETAGWALFKELGCITCHQGVNLGGNSFQTFGVAGNYFADRGEERPQDQGRFNVTKNPRDRHRFKVPTLRNIELTAPYFHDGSSDSLESAVATMARYQLGFDLAAEEITKVAAFLKSLTGENAGH